MNDLKRLARAWRRADLTLAAARRDLGAALLAATEAGTPQKDIVAATGINRETIRLMVAKAREERQQIDTAPERWRAAHSNPNGPTPVRPLDAANLSEGSDSEDD